jgi:hypothetical protein
VKGWGAKDDLDMGGIEGLAKKSIARRAIVMDDCERNTSSPAGDCF